MPLMVSSNRFNSYAPSKAAQSVNPSHVSLKQRQGLHAEAAIPAPKFASSLGSDFAGLVECFAPTSVVNFLLGKPKENDKQVIELLDRLYDSLANNLNTSPHNVIISDLTPTRGETLDWRKELKTPKKFKFEFADGQPAMV